MGGRAPLALILVCTASVPASGAAAPTPGAPTDSVPIEELVITGERPGPRLWKISKGDHVLWLLGTLTHLPKHLAWRSTQVEDAVSQSQQVLSSAPDVSTHVGPFSAIRLYFQWHRTQKDPGRTHLRDWLPTPLYTRFETLKGRFDPHDGGIEELRPSFAALRLYQHAIDAAGLTDHNQAEDTVLKLARQHRVQVTRYNVDVNDPSGALKEVSELPPSVEVGCLETTVTRLETDLPSMQQRARAWAVGDVDQLRALPYPD